MNRALTTLFLLMSVDGKISTGSTDNLDVDKDFPKIDGVRDGLYQYYDIEQTTDLWSLNSGKVLAKIGVNTKDMPTKTPVSFVVIDNKHLTLQGIKYLCAKAKNLVIVTTNRKHPVFSLNESNLHIIYQNELSLKDVLTNLRLNFDCERITIQTGGTLNALFLREKLIDYVDIVMAPVLIGGKDTPTLIDGKSIESEQELSKLLPLKLVDCIVLNNSYIRIKYEVVKK